MFDLRFNNAAVSNEVPLLPPLPPMVAASAAAEKEARARGGDDQAATYAELFSAYLPHSTDGYEPYGYAQYDADAAYDVAPGVAPQSRVEQEAVAAPAGSADPEHVANHAATTASMWASKARAGELRSEDFGNRVVLPADERFAFDVHLTPFANHQSTARPGAERGRAVGGAAPTPDQLGARDMPVLPGDAPPAPKPAPQGAWAKPLAQKDSRPTPMSAPAVPESAPAASEPAPQKEGAPAQPTTAETPPPVPAPEKISWAAMTLTPPATPEARGAKQPEGRQPGPLSAIPAEPAPAPPRLWAQVVSKNPAPSAPSAAPAAPVATVEGDAPERERDGVVAPKEWQEEQKRLATAAVYDDSTAGFCMPWAEDAALRVSDAPSLPGLEACPRADVAAPGADGRPANALRYVGGLDISFVKDTNVAVASLAILSYPELKVLHTVMSHCTMDVPYIAGYLAFREVDPLRRVIATARARHAEHFPQLFLVDGNGLLHYRSCGLATHLGVVIDAPTIGVAKNVLNVDGLKRDEIQAAVTKRAADAGPKAPAQDKAVPLVGTSGRTWGFAALTGNSVTKPVYISPGHKISTRSAMRLALLMAPYRVIEPIRQADLLSRGYIKEHFGGAAK